MAENKSWREVATVFEVEYEYYFVTTPLNEQLTACLVESFEEHYNLRKPTTAIIENHFTSETVIVGRPTMQYVHEATRT